MLNGTRGKDVDNMTLIFTLAPLTMDECPMKMEPVCFVSSKLGGDYLLCGREKGAVKCLSITKLKDLEVGSESSSGQVETSGLLTNCSLSMSVHLCCICPSPPASPSFSLS